MLLIKTFSYDVFFETLRRIVLINLNNNETLIFLYYHLAFDILIAESVRYRYGTIDVHILTSNEVFFELKDNRLIAEVNSNLVA